MSGGYHSCRLEKSAQGDCKAAIGESMNRSRAEMITRKFKTWQ